MVDGGLEKATLTLCLVSCLLGTNNTPPCARELLKRAGVVNADKLSKSQVTRLIEVRREGVQGVAGSVGRQFL